MSETTYSDLQVLCNYKRLSFVRRFNNLPTIHTEDVSQHTFYVTILAMTLADEYNTSVQKHNLETHPYDVENVWNKVDTELVMRQALLHDIEECFTSDIPWNVKHHSDATNSTIKGIVRDKMKSIYSNCSPTLKRQIHLNMSSKLGLEGKIVAIADMLECAWNCFTEEQLGNKYLQGMKDKALQEIEDMEFTETLYKTSELFKSMMSMLKGKTSYIEMDKMNLE